jgi:Transposase IS4
MTEMTNLYAVQEQTTRYMNATLSEIQALIGLHVAMGVIKLPRVRLYWDSELSIGLFQGSLSRERFFQLRSRLHFVNNLARPAENKDVFFKFRPLYDSIRNRCLPLYLEEELCVDEQMVPF